MKAEWNPMRELRKDGRRVLFVQRDPGYVFIESTNYIPEGYETEYLWTELPDLPENPKVCKHCGEEIVKGVFVGEFHGPSMTWWSHIRTGRQECQIKAEPRED